MNIKYNETILCDISKIFDEKKIAQLKEIANKERVFIEKKRKGNFHKDITITSSARERIYIYTEYSELTEKEKAFIYANIIFPNDEVFIRILKNEACTSKKSNCILTNNHLTMYIESLMTLKYLSKMKQKNEKKAKLLNYCQKISKILLQNAELYLGKTEIEPIITKISEILTYNKDLFNSNQEENTKTR